MHTQVDVAIVTVLPEEFRAVCDCLPECRKDPGSQASPNLFSWHLGSIQTSFGGAYNIVVAQAGHAGTNRGGLCVSKTIDRWKPRYVFLVGIAGGFEKDGLGLGDIAVSDHIWGYEYGKIGQAGFLPRNDLTYPCDMSLLNGILAHASTNLWLEGLTMETPDKGPLTPKVVPGPVASGDKVVDEPGDPFFASVRKHWPGILAVEMEGCGAAEAIQVAHAEGRSIGFIMVRGVSDMPGAFSIENADVRRQWKQAASKASAQFVASYIRSGLPIGLVEGPVRSQLTSAIDKDRIRSALHSAVDYLFALQGDDGGIPATRQGQESGAWTSASVLESVLDCEMTSIRHTASLQKLLGYVLISQLADGGWPLVNSQVASTMATGHATAALTQAMRLEVRNRDQVALAVKRGAAWLKKNKNSDYGWGVEPASSSDGRETRIVSTFYALRPALRQIRTSLRKNDVDAVLQRLLPIQRSDGGWPFISGFRIDDLSEVSNTARVLQLILASSMTDKLALIRGISFLEAKRFDRSWRVSVEGFYADASHAQNVIHNNSPCDALDALLDIRPKSHVVTDALAWLIDTQSSDGSWELRCPDASHRDYYRATTWPTSEFIHVLTKAQRLN